jgi:hypothetical protein
MLCVDDLRASRSDNCKPIQLEANPRDSSDNNANVLEYSLAGDLILPFDTGCCFLSLFNPKESGRNKPKSAE